MSTLVSSLLINHKKFPIVALLIIVTEIIADILVINNVKYMEVDWVAYMQEVEGVLNGTFDYSQLKGDTGPLVYPAGFVYIFGLLYFITDYGTDIRFAQYIFLVLHLAVLGCVFCIYHKTKKVPPYGILFACCISFRIHSIFVLSIFNDVVSVLFAYIAFNLFLKNQWSSGSVFFSLGVSVKMNILLYAPAVLLIYLYLLGLKGTLFQLFICGLVQFVLGLPFLLANPVSYILGSFDFGRVFLYEWTVNWRLLPESVFVSRYFHALLLVLHVFFIWLFLSSWKSNLKCYATLNKLRKAVKTEPNKKKECVIINTGSDLFILPLFTCNFIGVTCSRSLHYQFYVWYFYTLPFLLWSTTYTDSFKLIIMVVIELCWNAYPSTILSSSALHISHLTILYGLYRAIHEKKD